MAIRNLARGGGAANKPIIDQLKDLEKTFRNMQDAASNEQAKVVIAAACKDLAGRVVTSAQAQNVPHEAQRDIFYSTRQPADKKKGISGLVGLRKRGHEKSAHGYVEWFAGRQVGRFAKTARSRRRAKALVVPVNGRKIGENLATMWELGTTKMAPRPFFRTAVEAGKAAVVDTLKTGYQKIIDSFGQ